MPDQKTKPQSILITGCSSGIGYYCAHQLHQRGYQVIASCRKKEDVQKLQSEGIDCLELDLEDSQSVRNAFDEVMEKTGGELDALFNNGAFGQPGAVEDLPREGLTDTLRLELHGTGVQVCLIEPGPILSEFRANGLKVFEENIDTEASRHRREYEKQVQRLRTEGPAASFTLGPEAVYQRVLHALESPNPKIRYYVTFPTYLMAGLKRILPHRWLDYFLRSNS